MLYACVQKLTQLVASCMHNLDPVWGPACGGRTVWLGTKRGMRPRDSSFTDSRRVALSDQFTWM